MLPFLTCLLDHTCVSTCASVRLATQTVSFGSNYPPVNVFVITLAALRLRHSPFRISFLLQDLFPHSFSSCLGVNAEVPVAWSCWEKHGVKCPENGHGACPAHSIPECVPLCQELSPKRTAAYTLLQACPKDVSPTGFWPPVLLEGAPSLGPQNEDSRWEFTAADPGRELCACV